MQVEYGKRSKRKPGRALVAAAERRFLAPAKRRNRHKEVEEIVTLAQQGRFAPALYPVAAGEAIGWASAEVTAVEAQRAINTASRAADTVMRAEMVSVRLQTETAKAEKAGVPAEALVDEERRGRKLSQEFMSYRASQIDLSQPRGEAAKDMAEEAANRDASPCTVSDEQTDEQGQGNGESGTAWSDHESIEVGGVSDGGTVWSDRRPPQADRQIRRAGSFGEEETMMPADQVAAEPRPRAAVLS